MPVLVTRPHPAADVTMRKLEALGHRAIWLPLMQAHSDADAATSALATTHGAIAFTSTEALRVLEALGTALQPHLRTPVYCVGPATAQAAIRLGFSTVTCGPGDGAGLARLIADGPDRDAHVLYLVGHPRRPDFEAGLLQAGLTCLVAQIYTMAPIRYPRDHLADVLDREAIDAVLLYSQETANRFFDLLSQDALVSSGRLTADIRILCLSSAIAAVVPPIFQSIIISDAPDEDHLLRLV